MATITYNVTSDGLTVPYSVGFAKGDTGEVGATGATGAAGSDANVTTENVRSSGALMDDEVTNLAQVKAFDSTAYATAAQGTTADGALQKSANLSDLASASTSRDNLELGTAATRDVGIGVGDIPTWTSSPIVSDRVITSGGGQDITARTFSQLSDDLGLDTAAFTPSTDYATAAQGTTADGALQRTGGVMAGTLDLDNFDIYNVSNLYANTLYASTLGQNLDADNSYDITNVYNFSAESISGNYVDSIYGFTSSFNYAYLPYGADTATGYGYTTNGGAAYFPYGVLSNDVVDSLNGFQSNGSYASFPSGIDMGNQDILSINVIYAQYLGQNLDAGYYDISSVSTLTTTFLAAQYLNSDIDAGGYSITNLTNIYSGYVYSDYVDGYYGFTSGGGGMVQFPYGTNTASGYGYTTNGGDAYFPFGVNLAPLAIGSLSASGEGSLRYVNDALAPAVGSTVVGGGSAKCLVCYNGTNWIVTALL